MSMILVDWTLPRNDMDGVLGPAAFREIVFPQPASSSGLPVNFALESADAALARSQVWAPSAEDAFVRWILTESGVDPHNYKAETLRRRVPACLRALRAPSTDQARLAIQRNSAHLKTALGAIVIGVTSFFRDEGFFETLAKRILPDLTYRGAGARIWSVGCSEGQELYSVAILLAEMGVLHRCSLLGTDCRTDAVTRASEGFYDAEAVMEVKTELRQKYFVQDGERWRIHPWLRTVVQWRAADALAIQEPGAWDLILCRNLAIYLTAHASARLWNSLAAALRCGGTLGLGNSERPLGARGLLPISSCFYRRSEF